MRGSNSWCPTSEVFDRMHMPRPLKPEDFAQCPLPITAHDTVQMGHGSGGRMMHDLVAKLFVWAFDNPILSRLDDQAVIDLERHRLAMSTDSFVVDPLFFPGGDIGDLAVNGTVNDVCMCGARPLYLSAGFIIEEGFALEDLKRIVLSMKRAAQRAEVNIITGDTKVVNKGKGDKLFVNTTGIGILEHGYTISSSNLKEGDRIILSGTIADHGIAVLSRREGLAFETSIASDTAPLNDLVQNILKAGGDAVHAMRDPTRGGLAATLNEFASGSKVGIRVQEHCVPVQPPVAGACEMLGLDPLYVANEGKLVAAVAPEKANAVLAAVRAHELGARAAMIGEVVRPSAAPVTMQTRIGGWRVVDMPVGEQLPRIC
jgi:hydrogenase expression/formation protein HypE